MLRMLTAGESHGRGLVSVVEGFPAGVPVTIDAINEDLRRRQLGYGRGARMRIEQDEVQVLSGIRHGRTLGSPIAFLIENRDAPNWEETMDYRPRPSGDTVHRPRPGHADLAGLRKYRHLDMRNVLERASARETAARVVVGSLAAHLLRQLNIYCFSRVVRIGGVFDEGIPEWDRCDFAAAWEAWRKAELSSQLRCLDPRVEQKMCEIIDSAGVQGDTLGGTVEIQVLGLPAGLGSYVHWDRRLDGRLAQAVMSVPGIKALEIGDGVQAAGSLGSCVHDPILPADIPPGWSRSSNHAGGLEGGVTNGEALVIRAFMKPIATLRQPLPSIDVRSGKPELGHHERSDVCAVPAAGVVVEAMVAFTLLREVLERYASDTLEDLLRSFRAREDEML